MIQRRDLQEALRRQPSRDGRRVLYLHSAFTRRRYLLVHWDREDSTQLFGPLPTEGSDWIRAPETVERDLIITGELQVSGG